MLIPHQVDRCLVVDPKAIGQLVVVRYTGTIAVVNGVDQEALASVPVELDFRASRWIGVSVALIAVLLGVVVKVLSEAAAGQRGGDGALHALKTYVSQLTFPVTLILAARATWLATSSQER